MKLSFEKNNPKQLFVALGVLIVLIAIPITVYSLTNFRDYKPKASTTGTTFYETFDGSPTSPTRYTSPNWDITIHSRDRQTFDPDYFPAAGIEVAGQVQAMEAMHGPDCGAPIDATGKLVTHHINTYVQSVFQCKDHVMTANLSEGYGEIVLTPNHMVDFSAGEATVRWDMSTLVTSQRDFLDFFISPFQDQLQIPYDSDAPDLDRWPKNGISFQAFNRQHFCPQTFKNFVQTDIAVPLCPYSTQFWSKYLTPSPKDRAVFELKISRTHIKMSLLGVRNQTDQSIIPLQNITGPAVMFDTSIPDLGFSQGVFQITHHSYNPQKPDGCGPMNKADGTPMYPTCEPNTWHFDNVYISPALPFTIIHADQLFVDKDSPVSGAGAQTVNFEAPAPANAFLRFVALSAPNMKVSFDGGATYQVAKLQNQDPASVNAGEGNEIVDNYFTPIPAGVKSVKFLGVKPNYARWQARDISIWSQTTCSSSCPPPPPPPVSDTVPPQVSITSPTNGATVSGASVSVAATASDNVGVTQMEFYVDGSLKSTVTSAPYAYSLNTTSLVNGSHTISAKAYDAAKNATSSSVTVTTSNTSTSTAIVGITAPTSGQQVSGSFTILAQAINSSTANAIQILVDGVVVGSDTTSPFNFIWDTTKVSNGAHTIVVRVTNIVGPDASVSVNVNNATNCITCATGSYKAEYFSNQTLSGTPVFTQTETTINHDWGYNAPDSRIPSDHVSVRWTGTFNFDAATYRFNSTMDDGMRVFVDGAAVNFTSNGSDTLNTWANHPPTTFNVLKTMTAGIHTVKVEYFENTGQAVAKFNFVHALSCYDMDGDGAITDNDLGVVANYFGAHASNLPWDVNGDNYINVLDLSRVASKRGTNCS